MNRRTFLTAGGAVVAAAGVANGQGQPKKAAPKARSKVLMKVGMQDHSTDRDLNVMSADGVEHICGTLPSRTLDDKWSYEGLVKERERVESYGIKLDMLPLPLSSVEISKAEYPAIMLGTPDRDKAIDDICQMIRNSGRAGIMSLKYNMNIVGIPRTALIPGRGKSLCESFVYEKADKNQPMTEAGRVTEEMFWERITYFVKRVIPVAEEYKVRMAVHPQDPGMPKGIGWRGVERVLGSVDGLKRFVDLSPSPYHGLNFCQGTVAEMMKSPSTEIFDVIRYFGQRKKIFNVHFRNIKGGFLNFREAFPDEGDIDMYKALHVYQEVGYDGMLMPDHVPTIPGDPGNYYGGLMGFSYAIGYIQALLERLKKEG